MLPAPTLVRRLSAVGAACTLAALALSEPLAGALRDEWQSPPPDLRLLFTGSLEGFLEPCGCTAGRIGGMDRMVTTLTEQAAGANASIYVDCGDLVVDGTELTQSVRTQLPIKADAMFGMLKLADCEAMALGDYDLMLGVDELKKASRAHDLPILCANLMNASGDLVFEPFVVVERGGLRVGYFSLLGDSIIHPDPLDESVLDVGGLVQNMGLGLRPWQQVAPAVVELLREKADVIVCASHLGAVANLELAAACPRIDVICGPHADKLGSAYRVVGTTLVSYSRQKGTRPTRFDLWFGGRGPKASKRNGVGTDVTDLAEAEVARDTAVGALRNLIGRDGLFPPGEAERLREAHRAEIARTTNLLEEADRFPEGRVFSVVLPTVHRNLERDESVLAGLDEYHAQLHRFWQSRRSGDGPDTSAYPSPQECATCHPEQYDFWKGTRHSRAYSVLEITKQEYDAECFQCHTVGFAQPGGFMQPSAAQHFENVQCAACHGAGAAHMAGGESYVDPSNLLPIGSTCRNCHTKEHDPNFDSWVHEPERYAQALQAKVLAVSCPKMPEMGAGNSAFNASLVEAAKDVLAHGQEVRWDLASRLFVRAGDLEKGIAAAKRAVEAGGERPEDLRMYALTLLRAGRTDAADRAIERALADLPTDAELHFDLALLRLESNPESALVHAREAYSLDPANAVFTECVVRALVATGDSVEARRFLEKHLAQQPQNHELLDPLLEELPPE